jgi:DedD protein
MQRAPASDQELNLKKRARRRLVGAIALVLLMIIVLPMILKDRSASQPQDQITITLPSEQKESEQAESEQIEGEQAEASDFDSNIVPTETPAAETPEVAELDSETTTPDPAAAAIQKTPDVKLPAAKLEATTPTVKSSVEASRKFYVQIGVFSDAANVKQLQTKLSDLGYKSQTEKIDTEKGKKIRLRTQVFGDRNEAAIALENIKDAGLTGMVVSQ